MTHSDVRLAGRYTLGAELGRGGLGVVYRARDEAMERDVALKQVRVKEGVQLHRLEGLLEREYHALVRLRHPRIIEVYDYGFGDAGPYYTMELLDGDDLHRRAPVPYRDVCRYLRDIASSLALIHAHRLVHRDVSPRNVRFTEDGRAKLIDFGALCPFGPPSDIVGTPMCIAPEMLRAMPLDQRSDLYSLGATAYFALTGRPPYSARKVEELPALWNAAPMPPSVFVPGIPPELDALVLSTLSLDPLARPASAALVIDRLTAIADLQEEAYELEAESYLVSGQIVGRSAELERLERRFGRLLDGKGTELILEGAAGTGRTRLLREACLLAALKGIVVVQADAQASSDAFGVATLLGLRLLAACPDIGARAAEPNRSLLGHLSPELAERLGSPELVPLPANPGERRARLQTALYEWFLEFARNKPLLLGVDNLQAVDDNSAAFLSALGHNARTHSLMLLTTQRTDDDVIAEAPVRALRQRAGRFRLGHLAATDCEQLVETLFGGAANGRRLAALLHDRTAGNPRHLTDSVQLLVKRRVVRYVGGAWVLPLSVSSTELPGSVDELIAARLASLSDQARALAEWLCILTKPISAQRFRALLPGETEAAFFAALDELLTEEIVVGDGGSYRFAQGAVRTAVLAQLDEEARRAKHRVLGEALLRESDQDTTLRMDAGWHLLHGGDEARGADILAAVGSAFLATLSGKDSTDQAIAALCAALEIYEKQGRSPYEVAGVLFPLLPLAYYGDYRLGLKYGERCIELGLEITGLGLAYELVPHLGREEALRVGLAVAQARFAREQQRGLSYGLKEAIGRFCAVVPSIGGIVSTCLDAERLQSIRDLVVPLSLFSRDDFPRLMYDYNHAQTLQNVHDSACFPVLLDLIERFREPKTKAVLGDGHWKSMFGGPVFMTAVFGSLGFGTDALDAARELDEIGVRIWSMMADQVRLLYHALRGETVEAAAYLERVEVFAVQGSNTWQTDIFFPAVLFIAHMLSEDTVAVRGVAEQLARASAEVPALRVHAESAQAAYLLLRGDLESAIERFERIVPDLPIRRRLNWHVVRTCFAKALNLSGQHARAREVALEVVNAALSADSRLGVLFLPAQLELSLAEAGLGNHGEAVQKLDALIEDHKHHDHPLLIGLLHRARAEVAVLMRDKTAYDLHASAMEQRFRRTRNPALVAQCDRLVVRAAAVGVTELRRVPAGSRYPSALETVTGVAGSDLHDSSDVCTDVLDLLMRRVSARSGHLYVSVDGAMRLVRSRGTSEPERELEERLLQLMHRDLVAVDTADQSTTKRSARPAGKITSRPPPSRRSGPPRDEEGETVFFETEDGPQLFVLNGTSDGALSPVGGLILDMDANLRHRLSADVLESMALLLRERCLQGRLAP